MIRLLLLVLPVGLLLGCAAIPAAVEAPPDDDAPGLAAAARDADTHRGKRIRWGGTIAGVENRTDQTLVEVVFRPLDRDSRPRTTDTSDGRFLAVIPGFVDPAIYEQGRDITVSGHLDGATRRQVGDYRYNYPRVQVEGHHLWPKPVLVYREPPPYGWHDPWYRPWWDDPWHPHYRPFRRW